MMEENVRNPWQESHICTPKLCIRDFRDLEVCAWPYEAIKGSAWLRKQGHFIPGHDTSSMSGNGELSCWETWDHC